jgi:ABC-type transport system substrate-binding protein
MLKLGASAIAAGAIGHAAMLADPGLAEAQTPKRGGIFRFPGFDPPHFDPYQTPHWGTFINLSQTHSPLLKVKAGPAVPPGTLPIEPDLAESWTRPDDTTWFFSLKKGVRWHNKPPVHGRELTAEDVKYTYDRAMTVTGNPNRSVVDEIERVEAVDRYTVKFTTKAPYAWFLDGPAQLFIIPREAVEKFGDLKDVRVRRAMALAGNPQEMLEANPFAAGQGALNPTVPAALREWSIPIDQLQPDGRRLYRQDIPEAKRLLAEAGFPNGLAIPVESTGSWGPDFLDLVQVMVKNWKAAGIDVDLKLKEGGAFIASTIGRKFEKGRDHPARRRHLTGPVSGLWAFAGSAPQLGRGERPEAQRDDQAPAANLRRGPAAGDRLRHSALPLAAGVRPLHESVGEGHRRVGTVREELHAEHRQRLRRSPDGRLARSVGEVLALDPS